MFACRNKHVKVAQTRFFLEKLISDLCLPVFTKSLVRQRKAYL